MAGKSFQEFRDTWSAYRFPDELRYLEHRWLNLRASLRNQGNIVLPGGVVLPFSSGNKQTRFRLLSFCLMEGVLFHTQGASGWRIDIAKGTFTTPKGVTFYIDSFNRVIFSETYLHDVHFVDFEGNGRLVVDAGGFVGDTSLYYAALGFQVVSLEPDNSSYSWLTKNISLNPHLSEKITAMHSAIGEDGEIMFAMTHTGASSAFKSSNQEKIRSLSLKSILAAHPNAHPYLLHLDVKGVEFKLIEQLEVAKFERVRLEYTCNVEGNCLGSPDELEAKLRGYGFTQMRRYKHNFGPYPLEEHGTIDASK